MDKNAIKKYAVWARRELISRVSQKALQYGITEENTVPANATTVNGVILSNDEMKQRRALIERITDKGYQQVMEEVAYTWFNRFIALRFMEVNGYLPSHVRVFTDDENNFKPQILTEAINLDFEGLNMDKVYELKDSNDNEALFKYLLIVQCNALNPIMPRMFQKISDYTELLFPDNLLREGSVVQQMIELIPEEDWKDAVQIIGWLYQFYNIEPKADVFAKKSGKITKEEIPAATQLFTPDWIVRYMVENSLGRLWVEGHPNDELKAEWKYYLEEAEQEEDVQTKLADIRKEYASITPEQIKCIDPCAGSGHILAYMFDVLMQIYEAYGYTAREAVGSIVENNIYGLDIDERAAQLAYFSVMMKARQYDRRFFSRKDDEGNLVVPQPQIYAIIESNGIDSYALEYFINNDFNIKNAINSIIKEMRDAIEYGSVLKITCVDFELLHNRVAEVRSDINMNRELILNYFEPLIRVAEILARQYDIVITNPPYMSVSSCEAKLNSYVKNNYPDSKMDMFAVFIEKCRALTKELGFQAMITMHSWMFLSSYEKLREKLLLTDTINMIHLGARAFEEIGGEVVQTTSFVFRKTNIQYYKGIYFRLIEGLSQSEKENLFLSKSNQYITGNHKFKSIPGMPVVYWGSSSVYENFVSGELMSKLVHGFQGMITGNNEYYLRLWQEISFDKIVLKDSKQNLQNENYSAWIPYKKGGGARRWFGNDFYVLRWEKAGTGLIRARTENKEYYLQEGVTWSYISTNNFSANYYPEGYLWDVHGSSIFTDNHENLLYYLGMMNSCVGNYLLNMLNPTLSFQVENILALPVLEKQKERVCELSNRCIELCKKEWDSFETSWDFSKHPLLPVFYGRNTFVSECYNKWKKECRCCFDMLKGNEEEINRIFIDTYSMKEDLVPDIKDNDISVFEVDKKREVKSLISYAIGCMFGRYSLDIDGLAFAGGEWDASKYVTFNADKDSIIPISDDEYFDDDIVGRFVKFIEIVYGKQSLEENLQFIAEALGGSGHSREVIRKYFMNEFFADHCKVYQKRPIYWMFDSGKKNGFKALVYMHRYQPDTIARMRTDYVHEQQSRYRTAIADLEQRIASAATSERVKLNKKLKTLKDQAAEIQVYEEKIHHLADQYISIDLDDGVKANYAKFQDVLAKIK